MTEFSNQDTLFFIFLMAGIILCITDFFITTFFLLPLGVAFIIAAFTNLWFHSYLIDVIVISLVSVLLFLLFQKTFRSKLKKAPAHFSILGKIAIISQNHTEQKRLEVKVNSESWAVYYEPTKDIAIYKALKIGEKVKIIEVIGNKVKIEVFK